MDNYTKGEVHEVPSTVFFTLDNSGIEMKVTAGSKLRNLLGYSMKKIKDPEVKQMTWNASGPAIPKAISCAEIMKRKNKSLHQITKLTNKRIEEYWEPTVDGLDRLKVNRDIPAIHILLSKIPVDTSDPGYQAPGSVDTLWTASKSQQSSSTPRKHSQDSRQQGSVAGQRQRKRKHQKDNKNNSDKT